ncbi:MAG: metallophosphoesterase [Fibrobacter sp.]|nr:metallophosphoesterase [Fibrobacter sp.]
MIIFLVILLAALILVYINLSTLAKGKKGQIIAAATLVAIFLGMFFRETLVGSAVVSFISVWLCLALLIYIPWTLYRIGYYYTQPHHLSHRLVRRVSRWLLGVTVAATVAMFIYGVPHNADYKMRPLTVDLPSQYTQEFSAVFFTDIHIDPLFNREKLERFIAQADSIKPDYLLFGGDLADISTAKLDAQGYDSLFKKLTATAKIAAVAVNGNHESMQERSGSDPDAWMRKTGFVVLDDSTACLGEVCFTGRTDFMVARGRDVERKPLVELMPDTIVLTELAQYTVAVEVIPPDSLVEIADTIAPAVAYDTAVVHRPWILLDHQPKGIEMTHSGRLPDLALSGHTHDGQFFPVTFIIDYVWKLAYGKGALGGVLWLVSSGFDCWGPPVRFGSDSEFWVIKFKTKEADRTQQSDAE